MLLRPYDFSASSLTFCLHLVIFVPVACYFRLQFRFLKELLVIFVLTLRNFDLTIFGPIARHFGFDLAIFAPIVQDFCLDLMNFAAGARNFTETLKMLRQ